MTKISGDCHNVLWFDRFERRGRTDPDGDVVVFKIQNQRFPAKQVLLCDNNTAALLIVLHCVRVPSRFVLRPPLSGSNSEWDWSQFLWEHDACAYMRISCMHVYERMVYC